MDCAAAAALDASSRSGLDVGWPGVGAGLYGPRIVSVETPTELTRRPDCFYRATPCTGRPVLAAQMALAPCSLFNTDGTGFTNLYNFNGGSDGAFPFAGLILSGNTLMERRLAATVGARARCSLSTPMARVLRSCIVSRQSALILPVSLPTATELVLRQGWFYRVTPCMERQVVEAIRAVARCLPSTQTARALRTCIVSPLTSSPEPTATERIRWPD